MPGCERVDHGSCGNACCAVQLLTQQPPALVYAGLVTFLRSGGADGSYRYSNNTDIAGHRPSDRLGRHVPDGEGGVRVSILPDQFALQGRHLTRGGYIDVLNFFIRPLTSGGAALRAFSMSQLHGAFSDNGQNWKNLNFLFTYLQPNAVQHVLFGCGHPVTQASLHGAPQPIMPISSMVPGRPVAVQAPGGAASPEDGASAGGAGPNPGRGGGSSNGPAAVVAPPRGSYQFALSSEVHHAKGHGHGAGGAAEPAAAKPPSEVVVPRPGLYSLDGVPGGGAASALARRAIPTADFSTEPASSDGYALDGALDGSATMYKGARRRLGQVHSIAYKAERGAGSLVDANSNRPPEVRDGPLVFATLASAGPGAVALLATLLLVCGGLLGISCHVYVHHVLGRRYSYRQHSGSGGSPRRADGCSASASGMSVDHVEPMVEPGMSEQTRGRG